MMKKRLIMLLLGNMLFCVTAADFKTDFSKTDIPGMKIKRKAAIENGVLKLNNGGDVMFSLNAEKPLSIGFQAKVLERHPAKHPTAWCFNLYGKDGLYAIFRFRADNLLESYSYNGNTKTGGMIRKISCKDGEKENVVIDITNDSLTVKLNGAEIGKMKNPGLLPLTGINFNNYNVSWELDDLSVIQKP